MKDAFLNFNYYYYRNFFFRSCFTWK